MKFTVQQILALTDHTLLSPSAKWNDIKEVIDDGIKYGTASVCIPPCFVKKAAEYVRASKRGKVKICTVIGFPNGYNSTEVKCFEAECAQRDGADEIDMVANIGMIKEKRYEEVLAEINAVSRACRYSTLKVIVETCLLTEEEKIKMCDVVSASQAQYIKTSTGFSSGGATLADVELFAKHMRGLTLIKAAGGIADLDDAAAFLEAGAHRLGTSKIVKQIKKTEENKNGKIPDTSY
jgi:deoxyribose-phosphate aldolase